MLLGENEASQILFGGILASIAIGSYLVAPHTRSSSAFLHGCNDDGSAPGLWALTLSQVTTWIFARSLLTAALLAFSYGVVGALAYTAYYLSFFTGGVLIDRLRFHYGFPNIQSFLVDRFGRTGSTLFNIVIALRLLSEVFANLLVVGIIFGTAGSFTYIMAIAVTAAVTLGYSLLGGFNASIRTDVLQMSIFAVVLAAIVAILAVEPRFAWADVLTTFKPGLDNGWNLLLVALLQVWSYPLHDPVMTDRGYLADRTTTFRSFMLAGVISMICIFAFALLGIFASKVSMPGENMTAALQRVMSAPTMMLVNIALVVSAVSTLDSTLSSAAKLAVVDMGLGRQSLRTGRIAMILATVGGLAFLYTGIQDLYAAVALSGTLSMFLTPVVVFSILGGRRVATWSYVASFAFAVAASVLFFFEQAKYADIVGPLTGATHIYTKLLIICVAVFVGGMLAFAIGVKSRGTESAQLSDAR